MRGEAETHHRSDQSHHCGRSRQAHHERPGATTVHLRRQWPGHGADRHAWHREACLTLSSVLLSDQLRTRVQATSRQRYRDASTQSLGTSGVELPKTEIVPEVAAAITRLTRGNFRLLARLLTQMQRVVQINQLSVFSIDVVETTRENLVIGQA